MKKMLVLGLAALALVAAPAAVAKPQTATAPAYVVIQEDARVPFARTISDFHVERDRSIVLRAGVSRWYRATLYEPCASSIRFATDIGLASRPSDTLDRWSHVVFDGRRCQIRTLDQIERPVRG